MPTADLRSLVFNSSHSRSQPWPKPYSPTKPRNAASPNASRLIRRVSRALLPQPSRPSPSPSHLPSPLPLRRYRRIPRRRRSRSSVGPQSSYSFPNPARSQIHPSLSRPSLSVARTVSTLAKHSIPIFSHARQVDPSDYVKFHTIFAMDEQNLKNLERGKPKGGGTAKGTRRVFLSPPSFLYLSCSRIANESGLGDRSQ